MKTYFTHAVRDAIAESMRSDPTIFVFGEDVDKSVDGGTGSAAGIFIPCDVRIAVINDSCRIIALL